MLSRQLDKGQREEPRLKIQIQALSLMHRNLKLDEFGINKKKKSGKTMLGYFYEINECSWYGNRFGVRCPPDRTQNVSPNRIPALTFACAENHLCGVGLG